MFCILQILTAEDHRDANGRIIASTMQNIGEDCPVRADLFLPVDRSFPYSIMLVMGEHNHPPPPPEKIPTNVKTPILEAAKNPLPEHYKKLTARERLAALALHHRFDVSHPSFAKRERARQLVPTPSDVPAELRRRPDQIALFQLFLSGSTLVADYL